jgi:hypothetical protein
MLKEAADRLGVPMSAMQDDMNQMLRRAARRAGAAAARDAETPDDTPALPTHPPKEVVLCEHLVTAKENPDLAALVKAYLPLDMISDPDCRAIVEASLRAADGQGEVEHIARAEAGDNEERLRLLAQVLMAPLKTSGREFSRLDAVRSAILDLWRTKLERERDALPPTESARRAQLTRDRSDLARWESGQDVIRMEMP